MKRGLVYFLSPREEKGEATIETGDGLRRIAQKGKKVHLNKSPLSLGKGDRTLSSRGVFSNFKEDFLKALFLLLEAPEKSFILGGWGKKREGKGSDLKSGKSAPATVSPKGGKPSKREKGKLAALQPRKF